MFLDKLNTNKLDVNEEIYLKARIDAFNEDIK